MNQLKSRLGILPTLLLGLALLVLGVMAMNQIVDSWWPFNVERLDLVRATAEGRVDASTMMEVANLEVVIAFLAALLVAVTGIALPLADLLNRRFARRPVGFLVILRQSMWVGFWAAFCTWLQMNRTLNLAVAVLVAGVLILFEFLLQLRTRSAAVSQPASGGRVQ